MMNKTDKRIGVNYIFYTLYQILTLITPLITTPYVSRVLLPDGVGIVSYTHAIVQYVIVVATFGTGIYANRKMAFLQGNRQEQSKLFGEILSIRALILFVGCIVYGVVIVAGASDNVLMLVQGIYLLAEFFNIDWLFTGNEEFKVTVTRSFVIKLLGIFAIFLFVKDAKDIYMYVVILGLSILLGNLSLWFYVPKYVDGFKVSVRQCKEHIVGSIKLFMPQLAGTLYVYFDKIMLGLLTETDKENGFYEQTQKIIKLSLTIITTLPTVMLPRMANVYAKEGEEKLKSYLNASIRFVFVLGVPLVFGIIGISDGIIEWFFGSGYEQVALLLKVLAPVVIFNAIYNVIGYQYFLATGRENRFTFIILCGAITNVALNAVMIPTMRALGAIVSSLLAEVVVADIMIIYIRKMLDGKQLGITLLKTTVGGLIMCYLVAKINGVLGYGIVQTFVTIILGAVIYLGIELALKETFILGLLKQLRKHEA